MSDKRFGAGLFAAVAFVATIGTMVLGSTGSQAAVPAPGCTASATVQSSWGAGTPWAGEVLTVSVRNTSASTSHRWTATWMLGSGQRVQSSWGAQVTTSGQSVTAVDAGHNGTLAPGASTSFGLNLAGVAPAPTVTCSSDTDQAGSGHQTTVSTADSNSTVHLAVGDTLSVLLPAEYDPPKASGAALAAGPVNGGYPSGQPVSATFTAVAAGTADVTSQTDYDCFHTPPTCARPTQQWIVHVVVDGATTATTAATSTHPTARVVRVGVADSGSTVSLQVGDLLWVDLAGRYDAPPTVSGTALRGTEVTGGYPADQLTAYYQAVASGSADVTTQTDDDCFHTSPPCARPVLRWTVHVVVS